ncbi:hypothetical protein AHAS_Ahas20G0212400 [Arachis hypogaea]
MIGHSALLSALVERWRPKIHTFHLPVSEVTVTQEDVTYFLGLPVNGEPVTDKSTTSLNTEFLPLLQNFPRISVYSWEAASLIHLYRSLCCASRFNCKEMYKPLILLFVCVWERMPFLAPIPCDQLVNVGVLLARRALNLLKKLDPMCLMQNMCHAFGGDHAPLMRSIAASMEKNLSHVYRFTLDYRKCNGHNVLVSILCNGNTEACMASRSRVCIKDKTPKGCRLTIASTSFCTVGLPVKSPSSFSSSTS